MRVLKETGGFLARRARRDAYLSLASLAMVAFGLAYMGPWSFPLLMIGSSLLALFFDRSVNYRRGLQGERAVATELSELDDSYGLINDVKFRNTFGNIDHIVLGPNGVFVIETKNWHGAVTCNGDSWAAQNREIRSPSRAIKINALKIKQIVERLNSSNRPQVWIEGIVVMTDPNVQLERRNPAVPVLKIGELCTYIRGKKAIAPFSPQELEQIAEEILKRSDSLPD